MPHCLHDELSDHDRLLAMHLAVLEISDTVFRTQTLIDQSRTVLREIETCTATLIGGAIRKCHFDQPSRDR